MVDLTDSEVLALLTKEERQYWAHSIKDDGWVPLLRTIAAERKARREAESRAEAAEAEINRIHSLADTLAEGIGLPIPEDGHDLEVLFEAVIASFKDLHNDLDRERKEALEAAGWEDE